MGIGPGVGRGVLSGSGRGVEVVPERVVPARAVPNEKMNGSSTNNIIRKIIVVLRIIGRWEEIL